MEKLKFGALQAIGADGRVPQPYSLTFQPITVLHLAIGPDLSIELWTE
jgi:hypothetical protein